MNAPSHFAVDAATRRWALVAAGACLLPLLLQLPFRISAPIAAAGLVTALLSWRRPLPGSLRALLTLLIIAVVLSQTGFRVGRDTGSALLAAMLAIKPSETVRLRDARSLVGFALFAPFATFLLDQGPMSLALGLLAALLSLMALQRFADVESGEARVPLAPWSRLRAVGQLLLIGLPLALAAFWLFPRLGSPLWGVPDRALARPGLSGTMRPGDWLDLLADDTPALRIRFFGATPSQERMYWRGPVLTNFDGQEWTPSFWSSALPPPPLQPSGQAWDYELEVEPTDRRELVALDLPTAPPEGALPQADGTLRVRRPLTGLTRWRLRSAMPASFEPELKRTLRDAALALPQGFNPRTLALARQWRSESPGDDAAIVGRALAWVRREFAYTLDTPMWGRNGIDEFLFDTQAGYCEHFSASFVVLMRGAGIPARVVTGYAGGYYNPIGEYWIVRRSDAHAWAEVWLRGRGWVRVDPTAAVAPERVYDTLEDRAPGARLFGDFGNPVWIVRDWLRSGWNDLVLGFDASRQQRLLSPLGAGRLGSTELILLFSLASAIALLWMVWLSARGPREADPLLRAWHRMGARYRRLGLARDPHEAAGEWAERVAAHRPDLGADVRELSRRFTDWRYAPQQPRAGGTRELRDLIRALRSHRPRGRGPDRPGQPRPIPSGERK